MPAALRHVHDPAAGALRRRDAGEVEAAEAHAALDRADEPRDHPQRRRLAGAVRAEQADDLPRPDGQVEAADHRRLVVAGGQSLESQQRVGHCLTACSTSAAALPRYASITFSSLRTASGGPCAITFPNSSTTT